MNNNKKGWKIAKQRPDILSFLWERAHKKGRESENQYSDYEWNKNVGIHPIM